MSDQRPIFETFFNDISSLEDWSLTADINSSDLLNVVELDAIYEDIYSLFEPNQKAVYASLDISSNISSFEVSNGRQYKNDSGVQGDNIATNQVKDDVVVDKDPTTQGEDPIVTIESLSTKQVTARQREANNEAAKRSRWNRKLKRSSTAELNELKRKLEDEKAETEVRLKAIDVEIIKKQKKAK